ncbi:MAG: penicillin-binding transpeptidase domain-containing protein [Proteobacteria bacterium]|nr:penicillin-binding transpeptidase domain-containing protein [Pseudomonadota bacterium]
MTLRGRATLGVLAGVVVLGVGAITTRVAGSPALVPGLSAVSAAPRPLGPPDAPLEILRRLPSSRDILELAVSPSAGRDRAGIDGAGGGRVRFVEIRPAPSTRVDLPGPLRVEYTFDAALTEEIFSVLKRARVRRGHVIVLEPRSGRVLAYASTNAEAFPPQRAYPAASLVKIVTAAAALHHAPDEARRPCIYTGNPYRLRRSQLNPPRRGHQVSLERALATSNNHCFARLAVNAVGSVALLDAIARFGLLESPALGHDAGRVSPVEDDYDLGKLGCGLAGCRITPLHAAGLAATLATGERPEPWWVQSVVDARGRSLKLPRRPRPARVMTRKLADELRAMMVRTTTQGTAKSAFRDRRGRPVLGDVKVAGKTGNISGTDPRGRYEWFIGAAPADRPTIAVAVVQLHDDLWWRNSSQIASEVLKRIFCEKSGCSAELASRYTAPAAVSAL